jgi:protein transport protein SEC31
LGTATFEGAHFTSIDWETFGEDGSYPYGVIATGLDNGVVGLWDANQIIQNSQADSFGGDSNQRGLISLQEVHDGPVHTLAFNPFRQHLIASGGVEVAVHNLEKNIAEPDVFSPGSDVHQGSTITSVSWNRKVPHILGSASQNGISVVWDLKLNKSIFNFSDPSRVANNRNVCLSWNPEIPTQIAVVYDDAKVPELQIWDLRNPKGPIFCTQKGHTKGIHYLDWSVTDPSLIVTVGRDNKACIWNYKLSSDNLVSEFSLDEPASQVKWSPKQPEIYSVSNNSGNTTIYSLNNQLDHIPAWIRPVVGARFGFDGRLAVFSEKGGMNIKEFLVKAPEDELTPHINEFEESFGTTKVDIKKLCQNRVISELLSDEDREQWAFIDAATKNDHDDILEALGFDKTGIIKRAENYTGKYYVTRASTTTTQKVESDFKMLTAEEAEDFFDTLNKKSTKDASGRKSASMADVDDEYITQENVTKNSNWNAGIEKIIKGNILIGNIEGAVDSALKCGRVAEALLLAYAKGGDFFKSTIKSYVTSCNDTFVKNVIRYLVEDQIEDLVMNYSLDDWKECVALCNSLSQKNATTFKKYMDQLATRFIQERDDHNTALLCYILSKNFLRILETFASASEKYTKGSYDHTVFLMNTVEKIIALKHITGYFEPNSLVDRFLYDLSKVLHSYGKDFLVLNLITINDSFGFECLVMRDRLFHSSSEFQGLFPPKAFPFHKETLNVKVKKAKIEASHSKRPGLHPEPTSNVKPGPGGPGGMGGPGPIGGAGPKPIVGGGPKPVVGGRPPFTPGGFTPTQHTEAPKQDLPPVTGLKPTPSRPGGPGVFNPTPKKDDVIPPPIMKPGPGVGGSQTIPKGVHFVPSDHHPTTHNEPVNELPPPKNDFPGSGRIGGPGSNIGKPNPPTINNPPTFKPSGPGFPKPGQPGPGKPTLPTPMGGFQTNPTNPSSTGPIGGPTSFGAGPKPSFGGPVNGGHMGGPPSGTIGGLKTSQTNFEPPKPSAGGFPGANLGRPMPPVAGPKMGQIGQMGHVGQPTGSTTSIPEKFTGDVSQLPEEFQPLYDTIMRGMDLLDQIDQQNPKKKAEMDQKMNQLFDILVAGTMKPVTVNDLKRLVKALDQEDLNTALTMQQKIAREDYTANKDWLYVMRRVVTRK